jgi:Cu/Ag efflux pump CusA
MRGRLRAWKHRSDSTQERAQRRFTLILGLVLGVMLLLLYTEFGRLRQALLILGVVPLATLGGLMARSSGARHST